MIKSINIIMLRSMITRLEVSDIKISIDWLIIV